MTAKKQDKQEVGIIDIGAGDEKPKRKKILIAERPAIVAEKGKQKNKTWASLSDKDKLDYLAALHGIKADTVL